jgi:hypothetical protein
MKWIRAIVNRLKSNYTDLAPQEETQVIPDLVAELTVTYKVLKGTNAEQLRVIALASTEFHEGSTDLVRNAANTAADILCDKPSIGLFYGSIVNNMLYVPDKLREKPN